MQFQTFQNSRFSCNLDSHVWCPSSWAVGLLAGAIASFLGPSVLFAIPGDLVVLKRDRGREASRLEISDRIEKEREADRERAEMKGVCVSSRRVSSALVTNSCLPVKIAAF